MFQGGSAKEEAWGVDKQDLDVAQWQNTWSRVALDPWLFGEVQDHFHSTADLSPSKYSPPLLIHRSQRSFPSEANPGMRFVGLHVAPSANFLLSFFLSSKIDDLWRWTSTLQTEKICKGHFSVSKHGCIYSGILQCLTDAWEEIGWVSEAGREGKWNAVKIWGNGDVNEEWQLFRSAVVRCV